MIPEPANHLRMRCGLNKAWIHRGYTIYTWTTKAVDQVLSFKDMMKLASLVSIGYGEPLFAMKTLKPIEWLQHEHECSSQPCGGIWVGMLRLIKRLLFTGQPPVTRIDSLGLFFWRIKECLFTDIEAVDFFQFLNY